VREYHYIHQDILKLVIPLSLPPDCWVIHLFLKIGDCIVFFKMVMLVGMFQVNNTNILNESRDI
jgi:hypothetical protein